MCTCNGGYYGNGTTCAIRPCKNETCGINEKCISPATPGCRCQDGFKRNKLKYCVDIDECASQTLCDSNSYCTNSVLGVVIIIIFFSVTRLADEHPIKDGSFECSCRPGYYGSGFICAMGQ